jgi:structure-specific endonuclease subunit SLX1
MKGPWSRLPLTIRWLKQEYRRDFPISKQPPNHMPIEYGPIELLNSSISTARARKKVNDITQDLIMLFKPTDQCFICKSSILDSNKDVFSKNCLGLKCINCNVIVHTICMAKYFLNKEREEAIGDENKIINVLPIEGNCPKCDVYLLWGDLIKYRQCSFKSNNDDDELNNDEEMNDDDNDDFSEEVDLDEDENDGTRFGEL